MQALKVVFLSASKLDRFLIILVVLIALVNACGSDEYQIRVEKKTKSFASEESYKILHGNQVLATSEAFTDNAVRNYYHCIPKFDDGSYILSMSDRYAIFLFSGNV